MAASKVKNARTGNKENVNFRLDPAIKARMARAAAIKGQELADFAISTLSEKADEIIERHDNIVLGSDDYQFFLRALADNKKPSKRSRAAAARYRQGRRKGVRYHFAD